GPRPRSLAVFGRRRGGAAGRALQVCAAVKRSVGGLLGLALPVLVAAQGTEPLRKTDLIRLLSNPIIRKGEVADLVRRNCLAFRPTERDWADLRDLGADADVMSSVGGCTARTSTPRGGAAPRGPAPELLPVSAALEAVPLASRVTAAAGSDVVIRVQARRGETPEPGVRLALRGGSGIPGAPARNPEAVTTDRASQFFTWPLGRACRPTAWKCSPAGGRCCLGDPQSRSLSLPQRPPAPTSSRNDLTWVGKRGPSRFRWTSATPSATRSRTSP